MLKKIDCEECKYVCEDERLSGKWWKAYMCGNSESEYFRCLLNVDKRGNKLSNISWIGCRDGKLKSKEGGNCPPGNGQYEKLKIDLL